MADAHVEEHSSLITTPRQLIVVVVLSFVIPVIGLIMIASFASGGLKMDSKASDASEAAVARRLKPVGDVAFGDIAAPAATGQPTAAGVQSSGGPVKTAAGGPDAGKKLYDTVCMACHAAWAVLVTADLLGVTAAMTGRVFEAVRGRHRLGREGLLLNASHTHSGPVTADMLSVAYDLTPEQDTRVRAYTADLEGRLVDVIGRAFAALRPARLSYDEGRADFAANRRVQFTPDGPVDHAVPVLRVAGTDGRALAIVFGYACHNTTLQAGNCLFHGDYAGVAQAALERRHPGATALYVAGCGGDANPKPRGTVEQVASHGTALADAVDAARATVPEVDGPLRLRYGVVDLAFAPAPERPELERRLQDADVYVRRHARLMLDVLAREGHLPAVQPAPVQAWHVGKAFTLVAIGGEVVVDYALRLKRDYTGRHLWVAGYSNDVFGYLPSLRVLKEGGYEGGGAMIYYGRPGPFAPDVEERIHAKVRELMEV